MAEEMNTPFEEQEPKEELTIKFAKGVCSEPFMSKDGKELVRIKIPNADENDHRPWQSFVLGANQVHENQYGKGLWAKIPADGTTTVTKAVQVGERDGKRLWEKTGKRFRSVGCIPSPTLLSPAITPTIATAHSRRRKQ